LPSAAHFLQSLSRTAQRERRCGALVAFDDAAEVSRLCLSCRELVAQSSRLCLRCREPLAGVQSLAPPPQSILLRPVEGAGLCSGGSCLPLYGCTEGEPGGCKGMRLVCLCELLRGCRCFLRRFWLDCARHYV
jgi:hypothetical protein